MIREIAVAYTDPLAGGYLGGLTLLTIGVFIKTPLLIVVGIVFAISALLVAGVTAYAE